MSSKVTNYSRYSSTNGQVYKPFSLDLLVESSGFLYIIHSWV
jgi:hypothetical protein